MPKTVIKETDKTGEFSLPSADHAVYIPGFVTSGDPIPAIRYTKKGSLGDAAKTIAYDKTRLSYKLAEYLLDTLGMSVVFEGLASNADKVPEDSWKYLSDNRDRIPLRFLTTGEFRYIDQKAVNCAKNRGDCTALLCIDETKIEGSSTATTPYSYKLLTSNTAPSDWTTATNKYFKISYTHIPVGESIPEFKPHNYWVKVSDIYYCLGEEPSDWDENYTNYYEKTFVAIDGDTYVANEFYEGLFASNYDVNAIRAKFNTVVNGQYAAGFTPSFTTNIGDLILDETNPDATVIPATFGYLFAYARMIQNQPEWIATAGPVNGVIPELREPLYYYSDADAQILLGGTDDPEDLDDLQDGVAVNPIVDEYPFGVVIWGARTLRQNLKADGLKATSFLNVRNLTSTLKKVLRNASRRFTFSQNSDTLWYNFKSRIEPTLESMKNGNGINGYLIEQVPTTVKARLKAKITIIPIEPVEDFDLEVILTDSITVNE